MLFNSHIFIFCFFPIFYLLYLSLVNFKFLTKKKLFLILIIIFSLFFYSYWNLGYLPIILISIIINYFFSKILLKKINKYFIFLPILFNILLLFYYKYFPVIHGFLNEKNIVFQNIIIPLGISFFTFQQIGYLIELKNDKKKKLSFLEYFSFVIFFPQLIAGPILKVEEFFPKIIESVKFKNLLKNFLLGLIIFFIGLGKKVIIADNIAIYIDNFYQVAEIKGNINFYESWLASIGYIFQLYFDFSGYSDMAIGLARFFGLDLPCNFNSPLKRKSIQDFWRTWHITLTRFTTNYIFTGLMIKLSNYNLNFKLIFAVSASITFLLIGAWHGAGLNFLIFGIIHAFAYLVNKVYSFYIQNRNIKFLLSPKMNFIYWILTFSVVVISFVFFRSPSTDIAINIVATMTNFNSLLFPEFFFNNNFLVYIMEILNAQSITTYVFLGHELLIFVLVCLIIVLIFPNTQNISKISNKIIFDREKKYSLSSKFILMIFFAFVLFSSLMSLNNNKIFLYYQF
tara:strand:+ start:3226 stop:4761 length:1536 start_codon:yes stop_codon:yes gene_type:complete